MTEIIMHEYEDAGVKVKMRLKPRTTASKLITMQMWESGAIHKLAIAGYTPLLAQFLLIVCEPIEFAIKLADLISVKVLPLRNTKEYYDNKEKYKDMSEEELETTMHIEQVQHKTFEE